MSKGQLMVEVEGTCAKSSLKKELGSLPLNQLQCSNNLQTDAKITIDIFNVSQSGTSNKHLTSIRKQWPQPALPTAAMAMK